MLCGICKQNQAVVHIETISDGEQTTLHACAECVAKRGVDLLGEQGIDIADCFSDLSRPFEDQDTGHPEFYFGGDVDIICHKCGWDMRRFQETGMLGCESCYDAFSEILSDFLKKNHKGLCHLGKRPNVKTTGPNLVMIELLNLQKQLDAYVSKEEYEKAAKLRDQIGGLNKKLDFVKNG